MRVVGLASDTSADGISAVLAEIDQQPEGRISAHTLNARWSPHSGPLRLRMGEDQARMRELGRLDQELGASFGDAGVAVMSGRGRAELAGLQGHTLCHIPEEGVTLQLGEPAVVAERTGLPVVARFAAADLAAGGQGAPLVPFADWHLLADDRETRACLNLGGIATVTVMPAGGGLADLVAFDVGPANLLIDALGGDDGGAAALLGRVDEALLAELFEHPFFARRPPKSCGRADFGVALAERARARDLNRPDLMATLTALTTESVAHALGKHRVDRLLISGDGVYNRALVLQLGRRFRVLPTDAFGVGARSKEALAFAILAFAAWCRIPTGLPNVTGARHPTVLGQLAWP